MNQVNSRSLAYQTALLQTVKEDLLSGKQVRLQALGWSMLPFIWHKRDTITLAPLSSDSIKVGRIVFAQMGSGRYVVHRISRIMGTRIELRGDGNPYQEEYVHPDTIFGELVEINRNGKVIKYDDVLWNMVRYVWPSNSVVRRILLYLYRVFVLRKTWEEMRIR